MSAKVTSPAALVDRGAPDGCSVPSEIEWPDCVSSPIRHLWIAVENMHLHVGTPPERVVIEGLRMRAPVIFGGPDCCLTVDHTRNCMRGGNCIIG
jgi:hypothetical protein